MMGSSLPSNIEVSTIDSLLETRRAAPILDDDDDDERCGLAAIEPNERIRFPGPVERQVDLGPAEKARVHSDVYGRPPEDVARREARAAALEGEIRRLPEGRRRSLAKALRRNPMLFVSSMHARLVLDDEFFEPRDAAGRMARYWERREAMFGDKAFSDGVFTQPSYDDYLHHYDKCIRVISESNADEDMQFLASQFIRCVHGTKIAAMDRIIDESACAEDKAALLEARKKCPEVADSEEHKLLFLRCEDFVEAKAAMRMLKYWKAKRLFFGPEVAYRAVSLADMNDHIFELEQQGAFRLMPGTDAHGRTIMICYISDIARNGWTEEGFARYLWYVLEAALEREECRVNGLVLLTDHRQSTEDTFDDTFSRLRQIGRTIIHECVPVKVKSFHVCFRSGAWWRRLVAAALPKLASFVTSQSVIHRVVIHADSDEENVATLEDRYGIPRDQIPAELGGNVDYESWKDWLEKRNSEGL